MSYLLVVLLDCVETWTKAVLNLSDGNRDLMFSPISIFLSLNRKPILLLYLDGPVSKSATV